ncbi:MAG: hypothetical protein M1834_009473 [Cirrosporium novae-zelandiae]|nr:MAG: hypothetical protein M1834_009473 [Cirrosporium novae-zelandiae]
MKNTTDSEIGPSNYGNTERSPSRNSVQTLLDDEKFPSPVITGTPDLEKQPPDSEPSPATDRPVDDDDDRSHCTTIVDENGPDGEKFTYPEGGLRAWLVVFGSFCAMMAAFGVMNTVGIFQSYLKENQLRDYDESTISWIFSVYNSLSFFCSLFIGPIFDAKGPRLLIFLGSLFTVLAFFLLGICTEYWHFMMVFGFIGGTGTSLLFTPAVSSIGHFFLKKRASATGFAATGGSVGSVIFPLLLQPLFPKIGFAWGTRILAFILIFLCICACLLVRSRLPPSKNANVMPDFRIFRDPAFTMVTAGVFFIEWALFVPIAYLTSYTVSVGLSETYSYQIVAILGAGSCLGRLLPGIGADYIGAYNAMIITIVPCIICTLGLWLPAGGSWAMVVSFAVVFGIASGSNISLTPVTVGKLCSIQHYGRYYATTYFIVAFGTLTGIPIAGQILAVCGGKYWGLILFTGLNYVAGLICFMAARIIKVGWHPLKNF